MEADTVRLDTYSSAPVAISVYEVDPADVLTAGSNFSPRAIVTRARRPAISFTFTPPGGYQFQSNVVTCRSASREGFFVVEARRGERRRASVDQSLARRLDLKADAGRVVALRRRSRNRHAARAHARAVRGQSQFRRRRRPTRDGIVRWNRSAAPGLRARAMGRQLRILESAAAAAASADDRRRANRLGRRARRRHRPRCRLRANALARNVLRASTGSRASSRLRDGATTVGEQRVALDAAGAFTTSFVLPANAAAGEYAVLAQAGGGIGGATVDVDANAGGVSLEVNAACNGSLRSQRQRSAARALSHGGVTVRVTVVRSPHVYAGDVPESAPWATSAWFDAAVPHRRRAATRRLRFRIRTTSSARRMAFTSNRTAPLPTTRVSVPTADAAIRLESIAPSRASARRSASTFMPTRSMESRSPARR